MTWPYATPGIPDDLFYREEGVPMTKAEVRAVVLSKLRLRRGGVLVDVGSGTGTVTVEAALLMGEEGYVCAVEKDPRAAALTRKNTEKFGVANRVAVVEGEAPEALEKCPRSDRYFIGGGGRRLGEIIRAVFSRLEGNGVVVIDVVTLESLRTALEALEGLGVKYEVVQIWVARGERRGGYTVMTALNPVYVVTAYA
ncbi:precorrin-6Y C5,15-methyltransferase (decarboxylating), CbiT subunit [Pyrobaculum oguniense TE7]|uniref:Probable cobalt-precorrin-6B C(15)-methyltransferase (decarboxylating) n=1 Tax=Pyrobaculum oguniense (strain DSM 13380 / JCM 10595 / TE7) TaxID=698757 RepID=H6QAB2_PYROT|nr:precorrin-6Y C5,15-methyltransferase (decarboxylating), CbiT subunit [Pyrobaculum oguniense TE7]